MVSLYFSNSFVNIVPDVCKIKICCYSTLFIQLLNQQQLNEEFILPRYISGGWMSGQVAIRFISSFALADEVSKKYLKVSVIVLSHL